MNVNPSHTTPAPERYACRCLKVTESTVVEAICTLGVRTVRELRNCTGAGNGCNGCHRKLQHYIEREMVAETPSVAPELEPACIS